MPSWFHYKKSAPEEWIEDSQLVGLLEQFLQSIPFRTLGKIESVLLVPPDFSRFYSKAGFITSYLHQRLPHFLTGKKKIAVMPAVGTHHQMTQAEKNGMFGEEARRMHFLTHNFRTDCRPVAQLDEAALQRYSEGQLQGAGFSIGGVRCGLNQRLVRREYDLVLSLGQVCPHELLGMANYTKNILVGLGGKDLIDKSHFLGALLGIKNRSGKERLHNPVRKLLSDLYRAALADPRLSLPPIAYFFTVIEERRQQPTLKGLFAGLDAAAFYEAAALSEMVNVRRVAAKKQVFCRLAPEKYTSIWLAAKAICRLQQALASGGTLYILAPALRRFGEDPHFNALLRRYGYLTAPRMLALLKTKAELRANLSVAAASMVAAVDGPYRVVFCPAQRPDNLTEREIRQAGYHYLPHAEALALLQNSGLGPENPETEEGFYLEEPAYNFYVAEAG